MTEKYKCTYDGNFEKSIWVDNGSDECMFEITPMIFYYRAN